MLSRRWIQIGEVIIGRLEPGFLKVLEDAERWRKLHREDPDATIDIYEEFDAAIEELNFLRDKLEAVKKVYDEMYHDYMNSRTTPLVSNYISKFREVLEAHDG